MTFLSRIAFAALLLLVSSRGIMAGPLAQFRTVLGDIEVELFEDKPATTTNFINLVKLGYYTNTFFHRAVPGFVVQGGGFQILNPKSIAQLNLNEVFYVRSLGNITNEVNRGHFASNKYGTIAMARASDPNSASTQWFFNTRDNEDLDTAGGGYAVFGRVVSGTNVLNFFNTLALDSGIVNLANWLGQTAAVFGELPVQYYGHTPPRFADLFYVDISLLNVKVATFVGGRTVTWNSVSNKVNRVDYTTKFPPVWQTFTNVTGTGASMSVTDTTPRSDRRFYRVQVDF